MVHPKNISKMDRSLGLIIAETATTGKFFIQELEFKTVSDVNSESGIALFSSGILKIAEPVGVRLLDYMRLAAAKLGIINWFDARYILDIELRAENYEPGEYVFSYPIFIKNIDIKNVSEKGTEYALGIEVAGDLPQSTVFQSLVESISVTNVKTVEEYFRKFARELEVLQFQQADLRIKFGSKKAGGGDHPAAGDQYHDEYYFILDPKIKSYQFKNKEIHDPGKNTSYENKSRQNREKNEKIDILAEKGTTILAQIVRVLQMSDGLENLKPGKEKPQEKDAQGSSSANKATNKSILAEIHQYYRVATHVVHKKYDHIRGRYAMKFFYAIWLVDQPNMYQFPEEIDLINEDENKQPLLGRLDKLITRKHLRKAYYHWYTGLNVDVLKMDLNVANGYYLPGVPNYWAGDYNQTTDGRMEDKEKYNWDKKESAYPYNKSKPSDTPHKDNPQTSPYIEDIPYSQVSRYLLTGYPQYRPRMEATEIPKSHGNEQQENIYLAQKIYDVLTSPFDVVNLTLEIIGDPWWLGDPNIMLAGKKGLDKIVMPERMKNEINAKLPGPDPDFNTRTLPWTHYGKVQHQFNGPSQIYYCAQLPSNDTADDLMVFDYADTVSGIYQVKDIEHHFKDGKWTQKLNCLRNITIPSKIIPRFVNGKYTRFEDYMNQVIAQGGTQASGGNQGTSADAPPAAARISQQRQEELQNANLSSQTPNFGAAEREAQNTVSSDTKVQNALKARQELENQFPAPEVRNPVDRANELVGQGISKEQAYAQSKKEYIDQLNAKFEHLDALNKKAYGDAGIQKYKPYSPETMTALALEKSNNGGLEDWKKNSNWQGPATLNNPGGLGHDVVTGRYNSYGSFDHGVTAINDYYNYGVGVPISRRGPDRYLLPSGFTGTAKPSSTGNTELGYINNISRGRAGGGG